MGVLIIAEAGVNHNGDLGTARALIDNAHACGADAVKFQLYDCEKLDPPGERREMLRKLQLSYDDMLHLADYAKTVGIEFMCTPFDVESLWFLVNECKVRRIKIASGHLKNEPLIEAAIKSRLPVILSRGMTRAGEIDRIDCLLRERATWLLCTSVYPCPDEDIALRALVPFPSSRGGLSDHSEGIVAPIAAVALGATVIEKHLTLDCKAEGPDHASSIEPWEFKAMVVGIRRVEKMLGDGEKRIMPSEAKAVEIAKERAAWRAMSS